MRFQFLALIINPSPDETNGYKMRRNLHPDVCYSFIQGVKLYHNMISIPPLQCDGLYDIDTIEQGKLSLTINAIVGENGSGKSTIIDYIVRILNNLSAILFGELYRTPGAEHLHYINDVYADLYVQIENVVMRISCDGNLTKADRFVNVSGDLYQLENTIYSHSLIDKEQDIIKPWDDAAILLSQFCYTIVTNFSLYAFNSNCYWDEATNYKKENSIRRQGREMSFNVDTLAEIRSKVGNGRVNECRSWLQGLFYKNDGYQVPIVIAPMRDAGRIDIQKEYRLTKERMLSLVFKRDEKGNYNFRRINGKLDIDAVNIVKDKYFDETYSSLNSSTYLSTAFIRDIAGQIRQVVMDLCEFIDDDRDHSQLVWNYIVMKMIKIVFIYPRYVQYRMNLIHLSRSFEGDLIDTIRNMVSSVLKDHSHVTRKLYRSIYYLKYDHIAKKKQLQVDSFLQEISALVKGDKQHPYLPFHEDELLPPPVFHTDFKLYHKVDINRSTPIMFNTLSSGEKQITYTLSTLYYHLANIDSSWDICDDTVNELIDTSITKYKYVMAIFDEIELYFHPEMQRVFISSLRDGLTQMHFRNLKGVQILLATHSPFILSDIPRQNVLFLDKEGCPVEVEKMSTFGANIHTMLKNSFFLHDGTIGAFSQMVIDEAFDTINFCSILLNLKQILETGESAEIKLRKMEYVKMSNYKLWNSLSEDKQAALSLETLSMEIIERNLLAEYDNMLRVKCYIDIIEEPLVKQLLKEQYAQIMEYVETAS